MSGRTKELFENPSLYWRPPWPQHLNVTTLGSFSWECGDLSPFSPKNPLHSFCSSLFFSSQVAKIHQKNTGCACKSCRGLIGGTITFGWKEIIKEVPLDTKQLCISLAMPKDLWGKSTLSWIALVVLCTCHLKNSRPADFVIDANSWKPPTIPLLGWGIQISCSLIDDFNSIQWEFVIRFPWSL